MVEVLAIGAGYNMIFILQDVIMQDPKLKAVSLELNYSASQFTVLLAPILSTMDEPTPTLCFWFYGIINILVAMNIKVNP